MARIESLIQECSAILKSEFKITPEQTKISTYDAQNWRVFLQATNSDDDCAGVYFPRDLTAHLNQNSEFFEVNLLHEYFGHGLFCEHAIVGKNTVTLEQNLESTEKEILGSAEILTNFKIEKTHPLFEKYKNQRKELAAFLNHNLANYEGFAIWMEAYLSGLTNKKDVFDKKMQQYCNKECTKLFETVKSFEQKYGTHSLIYQFGFPKFYDKNIISNILKKICEKDYGTIELCLLYGSKKPHSDIDLFIVSDKIQSFQNDWLDIYAITTAEFKQGLNLLDISITDPIFTGDIVLGTEHQLETLKQTILDTSITKEAIIHNQKRSEEQNQYATILPKNTKQQKIAASYEQSYRINAEELKNGRKKLVLK